MAPQPLVIVGGSDSTTIAPMPAGLEARIQALEHEKAGFSLLFYSPYAMCYGRQFFHAEPCRVLSCWTCALVFPVLFIQIALQDVLSAVFARVGALEQGMVGLARLDAAR